MKTPVFPRMVALLVVGTVTPLVAQNSVGAPPYFDLGRPAYALGEDADPAFVPHADTTGKFEVPVTEKAKGALPDIKPAYVSQDVVTLNPRATNTRRKVEAVVDLSVLRKPSLYRRLVANRGTLQPYVIAEGSMQSGLARMSAIYRESGKSEPSGNCSSISLSVDQRIKLDSSKVLEIVESEVAANPGCACEIVKASITASQADVSLVVAIVQSSISAAPEHMRIISQCAIASMPESIGEVQALLAKIDPNSGDAGVYTAKGSKSAKSAKVALTATPPADPLDRMILPVVPPIVSNQVTNVNPTSGSRSMRTPRH